MSRMRALSLALAACLALAVHAGATRAAPWMPLAIGNSWEYQGDAGGHQVETITAFSVVRGVSVLVKYYAEGPDAGLENYWRLAPDGSVLLAGFYSPAAGFGYAYEPPVRFLPVPPVVGPQPPQLITIYDIITDAILSTLSLQYDVTESTVLSLPAGTFSTFGVGQLVPLPGPSADGVRVTLDGRVVRTTSKSIYAAVTSDWFAEGVGIVQYDIGELFQLVSFGGPTPTVPSSWGALKRMYR